MRNMVTNTEKVTINGNGLTVEQVHVGQEFVLNRVRNLLEGSFLWDSGTQRS